MAEDQILRRRVEAIRPSNLSNATLKSGTVYVAILRPDVSPQDLDIGTVDVFWAKCPLSKNVDTLLKAFARDVSEPVKLFQGWSVLGKDQGVSTLVVKDSLCVVVAVYEDEVNDYLQGLPQGLVAPSPMRDITKTTVNQLPSLQPSLSKTSISPKRSPSNNAESKSAKKMNPRTSSAPVQNSLTPFVPVNFFPDSVEPKFTAWIDFVYNRREYYCQPMGGESKANVIEIDKSVKNEWRLISSAQERMLIERTRTFKFNTPEEHRAFWIFFHSWQDRRLLADRVIDDSTYNVVYRQWRSWDYQHQSSYRVLVRTQRCMLEVPPLPSNTEVDADILADFAVDDSIKSIESLPRRQTNSPSRPWSIESENQGDGVLHTELPGATKLNVSELFEGRSIDQLEAGRAKGADLLGSIKSKLTAEPSEESDHWLAAINNLEKQLGKTKTIVGVVGATGAGKSSVINAILDEERLVPTNCMRACTAVVTEISYNYEDVQYRAEIDFIKSEDWLKELKISFQDLFDGNGKVSRECTNEDSEAGVAYAKIKAVYPLMTKEQMENTTVEALLDHNNVKNLLGSSHQIENEDCSSFYKELQRYVDSKEKTSRDKQTEAEKARAKQMEFWPLIRVVRLYVKAPSLATGAVIVDLPGVHDSNQARAAVAEGYLKQCTGLWIVAPINRAVDDKSAKTLLGDTFKRQLKMDGGYNSFTFICSKTDDISITEAQDSLGLDEEMAPLFERSDELDKKLRQLKKELEEMKDKKSDITEAMDSADEELEVWEKLSGDLEDGKTVFAPKEKNDSNKRKRQESDNEPRKKSKYCEDSDDDFIANDDFDVSNHGSDDEGNNNPDEDLGEPLTEEIITEKISELKAGKKAGRRERTALEDSIAEVRSKIAKIAKEQNDIDDKLRDKCIRGRNEYSRGAIQQDFASGIRELDQEIAEEEDAANFNPEVEARDYDAVAKSLPVFCVSSRGYQKVMGRLIKDKGATSFRNVEDTGIPALQEHCKKLTVTNREVACKRFLNNLSQLLNSLRLWSSSDGTTANLSDEQKRHEAEFLEAKLRKLDTAIENAVIKTCKEVQQEFEDHLYEKFPSAINASINEANEIQARWGAPVNRENRSQGGLYWSTYKATVRRDGIWSDNNFNNDLIEPAIKQITPGWDKVFSRRLPQVFSGFSNSVFQTLASFHNEIENRAIRSGSNIATFQMLRQQLSTYREIAKDAANFAKEFITARQRDINREFVPKISEAMLPVYANTTAEVGPGQYQRMKSAMRAHVDCTRNTMFRDSTSHVESLLKEMMKNTKDLMLTKLDEVFMAIKRDYESVLVGKNHQQRQHDYLPKQQRRVRTEILDIVDSVEEVMKRVAMPESPEAETPVTQDDPTQQMPENNDVNVHSKAEGADHLNESAEEAISHQSGVEMDSTAHVATENSTDHLATSAENELMLLIGPENEPLEEPSTVKSEE